MIDPQIQQELRQQLETEKKKLEKNIAELSKPVDMGDDIDSFDEETDEAEAFSANVGSAESLKARLGRVTDALAKMEVGTYGKCEGCEGVIGLELLKADPESRLCRDCKLKERTQAA
ncbi:MAG: hypothetical protein COU11_03415 [Candidatus Harrisonbacteria bacterium CG10_big_fil_rev_8_21_14_0_10_49_15]|uniref:Zinc finger DksA/TraR C4-type domain-containing protein n=1 Tax=Candidatus Harrisonbacteria bacterium CG10_big_fil_rev_8_21_14_0_10_49_15 TaxID=1974587 RepID=A0A2H0UMH2_9BACT|nr:MAG: hypothetical protein COU11_03415 [Candidatus Harrisonbacteria bacterium CG10_big_fil_rev_8_21_14_0_10_49_15]